MCAAEASRTSRWRPTNADGTPSAAASAKPSQCPACGSADVCEIVYGYPAPELAAQAQRGEVVLGGCVIESEPPAHPLVPAVVEIPP